MPEIIALFSVLIPHLSATTTPYAGRGRPCIYGDTVSTHDRLTQNTVFLPTRSEI